MCITIHGPENVKYSYLLRYWRLVQWGSYSGVRRGVLGGFNPPPPRNFEGPTNRAKLNPIVKTVKIAEFRKPTPQDIRKKGSKILKLSRFTVVFH